MKGITKITLNQETVIAAIQQYFTTSVFDASQLARVTDVLPESCYVNGVSAWQYVVTTDSAEAQP